MTIMNSMECLPNYFLDCHFFYPGNENIGKLTFTESGVPSSQTRMLTHPLGLASSSFNTVWSQNSNTIWSFLFRRNTSNKFTRFGCLRVYKKILLDIYSTVTFSHTIARKQTNKWASMFVIISFLRYKALNHHISDIFLCNSDTMLAQYPIAERYLHQVPSCSRYHQLFSGISDTNHDSHFNM